MYKFFRQTSDHAIDCVRAAYLHEHSVMLRAQLGNSFDELAGLVGDFRFEEAARLLQRLTP